MKQNILLVIALLFTFQTTLCQIKMGRNQSFDIHWRFKKGKEIDAKSFGFNDSGWRILDVPHDWSIEDLAENNTDSTVGPFYKNAMEKIKLHLQWAARLGTENILL